MGLTAISLETLLAACMLLAAEPRPVREQPAGATAPEAVPARERTVTPTAQGSERRSDQGATMEGDQAVANPFAPASSEDSMRVPFWQGGLQRGTARGIPPSRTAAMPASPFVAVPPGATAQRAAATYGMQIGPAPTAASGKAYANYRPESPISPYMGLYAPHTLGVDNYNAYVRPRLEQQAFNRQIQTAVRDLELPQDLPDITPRTLEQVPSLYPVGPGVTSATYMKFHPYYSGYGSGESSTPSQPQMSQPQTSQSGSRYAPSYPGRR